MLLIFSSHNCQISHSLAWIVKVPWSSSDAGPWLVKVLSIWYHCILSVKMEQDWPLCSFISCPAWFLFAVKSARFPRRPGYSGLFCLWEEWRLGCKLSVVARFWWWGTAAELTTWSLGRNRLLTLGFDWSICCICTVRQTCCFGQVHSWMATAPWTWWF